MATVTTLAAEAKPATRHFGPEGGAAKGFVCGWIQAVGYFLALLLSLNFCAGKTSIRHGEAVIV